MLGRGHDQLRPGQREHAGDEGRHDHRDGPSQPEIHQPRIDRPGIDALSRRVDMFIRGEPLGGDLPRRRSGDLVGQGEEIEVNSVCTLTSGSSSVDDPIHRSIGLAQRLVILVGFRTQAQRHLGRAGPEAPSATARHRPRKTSLV